jgi:hypothetical protein
MEMEKMMATQSVQMAQQQSVRHLRYMYGAVTQVELNGFLEVTSIDDDARKQQIKGEWRSAAQVFREIREREAGEPDTINTRPLSAEAGARAEALRADPIFLNTFPNYPLSFEEVEIDKLVACQRIVHVEYVEQVTERFSRSVRDLIDFCLVPGRDMTPVVVGRTGPNAFTATSENPGLRFLGVFDEPYRRELVTRTPAGQPMHAFVIILGYGSSTINAFRVGRRLILNNGFHRLYALRSLGLTHAPVVVQQITHPEVEFPPVLAELPREYLISNPRPALLKDFFDDRLICAVRQRNFIKSIQVAWGTNEAFVPL